MIFITFITNAQTLFKEGTLKAQATNKYDSDTTFVDLVKDFPHYSSYDSCYIAFRPDSVVSTRARYQLKIIWYAKYSNVFGLKYSDTLKTQPTGKVFTDSISTFNATSMYVVPLSWSYFKFVKSLSPTDTSQTTAGWGINFKELIGLKRK